MNTKELSDSLASFSTFCACIVYTPIGFSLPDSDMHHRYFWENIIDILYLGVCHLWWGQGETI